ncbi:hypothetical protein HMPREF0262_01872 [Clostridium sp. ATCC 29733]|nr:hypothetical protein HMPREF0262_01872 [Clostridium sp. ATCC 29733]
MGLLLFLRQQGRAPGSFPEGAEGRGVLSAPCSHLAGQILSAEKGKQKRRMKISRLFCLLVCLKFGFHL